jgi:hypothetical protein
MKNFCLRLLFVTACFLLIPFAMIVAACQATPGVLSRPPRPSSATAQSHSSKDVSRKRRIQAAISAV